MLCGQQKPLVSRLDAVRTKCSEGLGGDEKVCGVSHVKRDNPLQQADQWSSWEIAVFTPYEVFSSSTCEFVFILSYT